MPLSVELQTTGDPALALLLRARQAKRRPGHWVTGDAVYGSDSGLRDGVAQAGCNYVFEVRGNEWVFSSRSDPAGPAWSGPGRKPTRQRRVPDSAASQTVAAVAATVQEAEWQTLTVAEGAQGRRRYEFWRRQVWECRDDLPGRECWPLLRRKEDGSDLKCCLSNAPLGTTLLQLGQVGASRWHIETEFELEKSAAGLVEYEVRNWVGWYHHMSMALLAGAFLLQLQQDWGKRCP